MSTRPALSTWLLAYILLLCIVVICSDHREPRRQERNIRLEIVLNCILQQRNYNQKCTTFIYFIQHIQGLKYQDSVISNTGIPVNTWSVFTIDKRRCLCFTSATLCTCLIYKNYHVHTCIEHIQFVINNSLYYIIYPSQKSLLM